MQKIIKSARLFEDKAPVKYAENEFGITFKTPKDKHDPIDTIIELEVR